MISFVLFLQSSEPSVNFNISKMVYSGFLRCRLSQSPFPVSAGYVVTYDARVLSRAYLTSSALTQSTSVKSTCDGVFVAIFFKTIYIIKQLLHSVFVIS